jgi:hypothetical protein
LRSEVFGMDRLSSLGTASMLAVPAAEDAETATRRGATAPLWVVPRKATALSESPA